MNYLHIIFVILILQSTGMTRTTESDIDVTYRPCGKILLPVCAKKGDVFKSFMNDCIMRCARGFEYVSRGHCPADQED